MPNFHCEKCANFFAIDLYLQGRVVGCVHGINLYASRVTAVQTVDLQNYQIILIQPPGYEKHSHKLRHTIFIVINLICLSLPPYVLTWILHWRNICAPLPPCQCCCSDLLRLHCEIYLIHDAWHHNVCCHLSPTVHILFIIPFLLSCQFS